MVQGIKEVGVSVDQMLKAATILLNDEIKDLQNKVKKFKS
jgi:hypothetical protein